MIKIWDKIAPKIWTRLFLFILMSVLLTWSIVGITFYWLGTAQNVLHVLSTEQVPRLMQTSLLSAKTANLAALSNRILYTQGNDSKKLESELRVAIFELAEQLQGSLNEPITQNQSEKLKGELSAVIRTLNISRQIENSLISKIDRLRWVNVEIQDETAALVADFSYNIDGLTRKLQNAPSFLQRKKMAQSLRFEQKLYAAFVELGNESSISTTLAIQSAASQQPEQLNQFSDLLSDALNRINQRLGELPVKAEFITLLQSSEALNLLSIGPNGLVENRKEWQIARRQLSDHLNSSFTLLSEMQKQLGIAAEKHRGDLENTSKNFADQALLTMQSLVFFTIFAGLAGLSILFFYIRPSIILPMQHLSAAMRQIAGGQSPQLIKSSYRNDEISQLTDAVIAFSNSAKERDQAIEQLRQTQSELVQAGKMAALGTLSAGISHELNQPLGAIRQRLHLADKALGVGDSIKVAHQTKKIESMVTRMEKIIDHLRRFARRSEYHREEVLLVPVAKNAHQFLTIKMSENGIDFSIDPALENACIIGDQVLLEQVLLNLMSNAVDAIIETKKAGEILLRYEKPSKGMVAFSVVDTGVGLGKMGPEEVIEPFVTTKPPGEGIGLGLSISYNILLGMGGNLYLARRRGAGTRATINLPGSIT
ncbi:MAG: ATP-binding protein [Nitratireductor sp.]